MATKRVISEIEDVPLNDPVAVDPELLQLDAYNPRLIMSADNARNDEAIIRELHQTGELSELLQSIASNGYLDFEPLVVMHEGRAKKLTVLEGNRRLAALDLLTDAALAKKLSITVPEVDQKLAASLKSVRVIRVDSRESARPFIAFKHINGPHRWESYAKAKFAANWYVEEKAKGKSGLTLGEIAERIGDNHDTIKRMVSAIYVLEQAEDSRLFSIEDRTSARFPFSHLYTALARSEYMDFLGLDEGWTKYDPRPNPIPKSKLKNLQEVLFWIFGSKKDDLPPVVRSQNPDIKNLGVVLAHAGAVHVLREQRDLDRALSQAMPADEKLTSALIRAQTDLQEAVSNLRAFDGKDRSLLEIAEDVQELAQNLYSRMLEKAGGKGSKK